MFPEFVSVATGFSCAVRVDGCSFSPNGRMPCLFRAVVRPRGTGYCERKFCVKTKLQQVDSTMSSEEHQECTGKSAPEPTGPDFQKAGGLLPAIAQDAESGEVLMIAYMNKESFEETLRTGRAVYYSRSRNRLWRKGEESGHVQRVKAIYVDCDRDAILLQVEQVGGAACHTGYRSCFYRQVTPEGLKTVGTRVFDPQQVYGKQTKEK